MQIGNGTSVIGRKTKQYRAQARVAWEAEHKKDEIGYFVLKKEDTTPLLPEVNVFLDDLSSGMKSMMNGQKFLDKIGLGRVVNLVN